MYNQHLQEPVITPDMTDYDEFMATTLKAGELSAMIIKANGEGWYQFGHKALSPILDERNKALHMIRQATDIPDEVLEHLQSKLKRHHLSFAPHLHLHLHQLPRRAGHEAATIVIETQLPTSIIIMLVYHNPTNITKGNIYDREGFTVLPDDQAYASFSFIIDSQLLAYASQ